MKGTSHGFRDSACLKLVEGSRDPESNTNAATRVNCVVVLSDRGINSGGLLFETVLEKEYVLFELMRNYSKASQRIRFD